jgi:4a-hydroxytetrahydrobiopterin dehydratase
MQRLSQTQIQTQLKTCPTWHLSSHKKSIHQTLRMKDFLAAVDLIQRITPVAQRLDHHPDLHLTGYRNLKIELSTHSLGGLSKKDFLLAAKIEKLPKKLKIL